MVKGEKMYILYDELCFFCIFVAQIRKNEKYVDDDIYGIAHFGFCLYRLACVGDSAVGCQMEGTHHPCGVTLFPSAVLRPQRKVGFLSTAVSKGPL